MVESKQRAHAAFNGTVKYAAMALIALTVGCQVDDPSSGRPSRRVAVESVPPPPGARARWISTHEARKELREVPNVFLLCVAEKEDYDRGHIPGSVLIPVRGLRRFIGRNDLWPEINKGRAPRKEQPVIAYCWWKSCVCPSIPTYSQLARKTLLEMGFRDIAFINGGMPGWIEDGLPVEKSQGPGRPTPTTRGVKQ